MYRLSFLSARIGLHRFQWTKTIAWIYDAAVLGVYISLSYLLQKETWVRAIRGNAQFQKTLNLLKDNTQTALTAGKRIVRIVESLKNFARLDEAALQEVDLHEGLDSALTLGHYELENRISVVKEYGEIPPIYCYPGKLNQVFMNLLVNAIQPKGTIRIETSADQAYVYVKISDTGKGIPPEKIGTIFDPGFTIQGGRCGHGSRVVHQLQYRIDVYDAGSPCLQPDWNGLSFLVGRLRNAQSQSRKPIFSACVPVQCELEFSQ